uniref:Uncharacterized protein n=1 Tax=Meloidogyne floridensis TaxID=298350 RepID=A0A915NHZ4_9BILA
LANNDWSKGKSKENIKGEFENLIKIFGEFTNIFNFEHKGVDQIDKVTNKSDTDKVEKKIKLIQPKEFEDFHNGIKDDVKKIFNSLRNYLSVVKPKNINNFGQAKSRTAQNFFKNTSTLLRLKRASPSGSRSSRSGYGSSSGYKSKTIIHSHYYGNSDLADFFFALVLVGGAGWLYLNFAISKYILWKMDCSRILCIPGPRREKIERELKNRELIHGELSNGDLDNDEESNIDGICPYVSSEIGSETFIQMIKNKCFSIKNKCIAKKNAFGEKISQFELMI